MLHEGFPIAPYRRHFGEMASNDLSVIAYRSRAVVAPSDAALQQLLIVSQARNRAAGLTGVLIYDRGDYFQWLEGPTNALNGVWGSIRRDPRHHQVTVLRNEPISDRVFAEWDLRITLGTTVGIDATVAAMERSTIELKRVVGRPISIVEMSLEDLCTTTVIPRLLEVHGRSASAVKPFTSTASIWHADADCGTQLAGVLVSRQPTDSNYFVDALLAQGANLSALYQEVFEPAQLQLGKLWDDDQCNDFHLAIGLARLQMQIWRVNAVLRTEHRHKPKHSVLLSAHANEPHRIGLSMSSEIFEREGWDVSCRGANEDQALNDLLQTQWFDVLKLSHSGALRRDDRLMSIRETIHEARAASLNPSLIVMVDGRTFAERPHLYRAVHADAMSATVLDAVPKAESLLGLSRAMTALCVKSAS